VRALALLFAAAFALRVAAVFVFDSLGAARGGDPWAWGHEPASLAQALLDGRGFSDPWSKGTGPSSWLTPPYPLLLAALMKTFGGITASTALALHVVHALFSALNAVLLVELGRRWGSARAGWLAAWMFAFYPVAIANSAQLVWDTTLVALLVTAFFLQLAKYDASARGAAACGLGYGALLLVNPAPMSLAPIALWFLARRSPTPGAGLARAALFAACAFAVVAPWMARNHAVLGAFTLRPNLGVELRIGNHAEANGRPIPFRYHPSHVAAELALYRELGEVEYSKENLGRARTWIRENPGAFVALTAKRVAIFWIGESPLTDPRRADGLSPRGDPSSWIKFLAYFATGALAWVSLWRWRGAADVRVLCACSLLVFGAPYYLTHVSERYRFPMDPLIVLLGAFVLVAWFERRSRSTATPISATNAGI
jgi:4-amino-4-deoxy-L-arabinose transferase-like glycosyltransferase